MKKIGLTALLIASLHSASFALEVDYGQGKTVQLQEELGLNKEKAYKVVWKDLIEPKLWVPSSEISSLEFDEKSCKQKKKYFSKKIEEGQSSKSLQDEYGQGTSELVLNFAISDFYLKSDYFRFALDKKGVSLDQVLKNDLSLEVKELEIIFSEGSIGELLGAENTESFLKEKISYAAFALEEYGKIVVRSKHLALNCALLSGEVEAINLVVNVKQSPKITWIKKISDSRIRDISFRAHMETALGNLNMLAPKKEGAVVNMMNYMFSLIYNNEQELMSNKELSYKLFTHLTNSDSSAFLKIDHDSSLEIALKLADKKESSVESQLTKNVQIIKESL